MVSTRSYQESPVRARSRQLAGVRLWGNLGRARLWKMVRARMRIALLGQARLGDFL